MMTFLTIASAVMAALSLVLHAVAPFTKTTADDKAAEVVDTISAMLPKK